MQNQATTIVRILLTTALSSLLLTLSAQAQERPGSIRATYEFFGYPTGVSELVHTGSLTKEQKDSIEAVKVNYDEFVKETLPSYPCRDYYFELAAYSDWQAYEGVTPEMSDKLNDILALDRLRKASRFLIDEKGVSASCLDRDLNVVYADSDVRGVRIRVRHRDLPAAKTGENVNEGTIADINERISELEYEVAQLRDDMEAENDRQDERINKNSANIADNSGYIKENGDRIDEIENRLADQDGFSIGTNMQYYAGKRLPTIEAVLPSDRFDLSVWGGYGSDAGEANLDEGVKSYSRFAFGLSLTGYVYEERNFRVGLTTGLQYAKDDIDGKINNPSCEISYVSVLPGISAEVQVFSLDWFSLSIYGNASYDLNVTHSVTGELNVDRDYTPIFLKGGIRFNL